MDVYKFSQSNLNYITNKGDDLDFMHLTSS